MAANYTPMVQQYLEVKRQHQDELLFFRLGDFYEMFFDDALTASRELNITLTGRAAGLEERIPMCGVPYHSVDGYIAKLIKKGYRIAICEQVEDPKLAKGIVERKVIKIITPGTALNEQLLDDKHNRFLVFLQQDGARLCLVAADISTGECQWFTGEGSEMLSAVQEQLFRIQPAEAVVYSGIEGWEKLEAWLKAKLPECAISFYQEENENADYFAAHFADSEYGDDALVHSAAEHMLRYLHSTVKADLTHINRLTRIAVEKFMNLDATAIRNLELVKNMRDGTKRGTLLDVLDFTVTSMGARKLRSWIECPLLDLAQINARQQAVKELLENLQLRTGLAEEMKKVFDLERIISRIEVGSANARDLVALRSSLAVLPGIKELLNSASSRLLAHLAGGIHLHQEIYDTLAAAIVDEPPFSVREGGMIRTGFDLELDELHSIASDNKTWMQNFEQRIKEETGIKTLKVGYNKVFGYYIEVSKGQSASVPDYFVRKQTLVNAEQIRAKIPEIQETARALANIDVLASLAEAAFKYNYIKPELNNRSEIRILDGRHPVVERLLERDIFVPNDTNLNSTDERMIIITGPNMAGKSTYMRQVALLTLMTQMGSFIPARQASICPVDKIFTRVGASDDLATGQSTFMVEMNEVAQILKYATRNSLIILDEVGRGTSTFDGMSIARAVMEYIHEKIKAKTLFATHYHQLIELENIMEGVKNYSVAVKERGNDIVFLRRIVRGGSDKSYGVHVARLAGLPKKVLERANEFLKEYDSEGTKQAQPAQQQDGGMMGSLFGNALQQRLANMDVMSMTPIEAMNTLYKLQEEAKREGGAL